MFPKTAVMVAQQCGDLSNRNLIVIWPGGKKVRMKMQGDLCPALVEEGSAPVLSSGSLWINHPDLCLPHTLSSLHGGLL